MWLPGSRDVPVADPFAQRRLAQQPKTHQSQIRPVAYEEEDDVDRRDTVEKPLGLADFAPDNLGGTIRNLTGQGPNRLVARRLYDEGEALFQQAVAAEGGQRRAKLDEAAGKYAKAAQRWPDSALEENALMMAAECYYGADRYPKAAEGYDSLIKKFPNSRHLDTVAVRRFSLARWWLQEQEENPRWVIVPNLTDATQPRFDTFGNAVKLFDRIRLDDPSAKLADDATVAAAGAYFAAGKYEDADRFYADLRKSFPNSPHQFRAHLMGVMCKLRIYQGPDYNGKPLDEAEELITKIFRQFPDQVAAEREYLGKAFKEVRAMKAQRRVQRARYYERRGEYGGARFYYGKILDEFPGTNLATEARESLQRIADEPDRPPQKMTWLANLFPDAEQDEALVRTGESNPLTRWWYDPFHREATPQTATHRPNSHLR